MSAQRARRVTCVAAVTLCSVVWSAPARADTVTQWNQIATNAVIRDAGQGAVALAHLAMVHGAVYDAVNAIDGGYEPYLEVPEARSWYSQDAAAATAAYRVLIDSQPPLVDPSRQPALAASLAPLYAASLAAIPDGPAKDGGIATGNAAADAMIAARAGDGRFGPFRFIAGTGAGQWRPVLPAFASDPGAWLKDVRPFLIEDPSEIRYRPPNPTTSRRYANQFDEVKAIGAANSTTRTADQTAAARFWGLANGPGTWSGILRSIADGAALPLADDARLFAMFYLSAADAAITTWIGKWRYSFWRPITAIREAAADGNPATVADAGWLPLIPNPPYPDHPSGLSALAGAAAATLQNFFGTDEHAFTGTNAVGTRTYTRFSQATQEIVDARVWSGIHFRIADEEGARIGATVARLAERKHFRPARHDDDPE
jgi:hypothetical protein